METCSVAPEAPFPRYSYRRHTLRISPWDARDGVERRGQPRNREREENGRGKARGTSRTGGPCGTHAGACSFARKAPLTRGGEGAGYRAAKNPRRRVVYQRSANRNLLVDHAHVGDLQVRSRPRNLCDSLREEGKMRRDGEDSLCAASHLRAHCIGDRFDFREVSIRQEKRKQKEKYIVLGTRV